MSARRLIAATLGAMAVWAAAFGGLALASPPEVPETLPATEITGASAELGGVLNPGQAGAAGSYWFNDAPTAEGCETGEWVSTPFGHASGEQAQRVQAQVSSLLPNTTYSFCLVYESESGERAHGQALTFTTARSAPRVESETVVSVGSGEALLSATIDSGGLPSAYHAEYGATTAYGASSPATSLGAASGPVAVRVRLGGLQPSTEYHVRFQASNELGSARGLDTTLTTMPSTGASASGLPDERVYERVSTTLYQGEAYAPTSPNHLAGDTFTEQLFQAAAGGNAIAYMAAPASAGGNGAVGSGAGNTWLAQRGPQGWQTSDISPVGSESGEIYEAFSSELTSGILQTSKPKLTADAPGECQELYLRSSESGAEQALITTAYVPGPCGHPHFAGASSDFSHIIFQDEAALTPEAQETEVPEGHEGHHNSGALTGEPCEFSCDLYEEVGGQLRLVNVLPGGEVDPNATFGGPARLDGLESVTGNGKNGANFSGAISSDGSRIFWTDTKPGADDEHIYVFENGAGNVPVSGADPAKYWTATPDGRYVFYTEDERLWRFDTENNTREELVGAGRKGENAGVLAVPGINQEGEDGAYVYLLATGVLAENKSGHGEAAQAGAENLYLLHAGAITFIAALGEEEVAANSPEGRTGDWVATLGDRTSEPTADGRQLVFESTHPLTGYQNEGEMEAFVYSAEAGQLDCASCNPTGALPSTAGVANTTLLPISASDNYIPRWISADGSRVFFMTSQSLVPQDTNGVQDVYEWEREGSAGCPAVEPARRNGGCTFLLSGGESSDYSYLVDASANGDDVFFVTRAQLVPEDRDERLDLYDARVDGYRPLSPPLCSGAGCQGVPPAPPTFATPASATFNGVGNFEPTPSGAAKPKKRVAKACARGSVKRRGKCVKRVVRKRAKSRVKRSRARRSAGTHATRAGNSGKRSNGGRQG